jgi:hypothetical protein
LKFPSRRFEKLAETELAIDESYVVGVLARIVSKNQKQTIIKAIIVRFGGLIPVNAFQSPIGMPPTIAKQIESKASNMSDRTIVNPFRHQSQPTIA